MSKTSELERMARLVQANQAETSMRVDAVEARVDAAAAAETGGGAAPPAAAPSLDGLYGWKPEAFSVWFTTGGGGKVGVCYPKDCASYGGEAVPDDLLTPGVQEDPDTKFRWCEMPAPQESEPVLVYTLVADVDPETEEPGDEVTGAFLEWTSGVEAAKNVHEAEGTKKAVACVPVARYDAKLDRLSQVHTGALALGGGGGGGGGLTGTVSSIGALLYNNSSDTQQQIGSSTIDYALYARTDTLDLATGAVNQGAWSKVFDTTPHEDVYT